MAPEFPRQRVGEVLEDRLDERPAAAEEAVHELPAHAGGCGHLADLHRVHAVLGEKSGGGSQQVAAAIAGSETAARRRTRALAGGGQAGSG